MSVKLDQVNVNEVGTFLSDLFGLTIQVSECDQLADQMGLLANYQDPNSEVQAKVYCDLSAVAKLGAALTQIPMGAVDDAIKAKQIPENIQENFGEVLNIAVNILPGHIEQRLALGEVTDFEGGIPATESGLCLLVDIERYGECRIAIV